MTPVNMAKHRNNPNMPFWRMIKQGYDHFEVTKHEPKVDFCEKKYVFDAIRAPNATRDPVFDASAKCPAYAIPEEVADAVREKQQTEAAETAKLISKGTPVARLNTGIDGGMHKIFAARVPEASTGLSEGGDSQGLAALSLARAPGTIPSHVNPPRAPSDNLLLGAPQEPKLVAVTGLHTGRRLRPLRRGSPTPLRPRNPTAGSPASPARSASAAARCDREHLNHPRPRRSRKSSKPSGPSRRAPRPRCRRRQRRRPNPSKPQPGRR